MKQQKTEKIVLGGGCFWCTEAVFRLLAGVVDVQAGYAGGRTINPTYKEVSSGRTGHAEVVQVEWDPAKISLEKILEIFFSAHDPTTPNRQGGDVGEQYRLVILYATDEQRQAVENFIERLEASGKYSDPVVTQAGRLEVFYKAEEEHQNFWRQRPEQAYCQLVIAPKVKKIRQELEAGRQERSGSESESGDRNKISTGKHS